jgi:hypothetical protein
MTAKPKKLSNTARALLAVAATRDDHLILPPQLPIAAVRQVARSLLGLELEEEVPASSLIPSFRHSKNGREHRCV